MSKRERKNKKRRMLHTGERFHAWYSAKMESVEQGHCIYLKPDGKLVKVTIIARTKNHDCGWDDMKYLGKVVGYMFDGLVKVTKPMNRFMTPAYEPEREKFSYSMWPLLVETGVSRFPILTAS